MTNFLVFLKKREQGRVISRISFSNWMLSFHIWFQKYFHVPREVDGEEFFSQISTFRVRNQTNHTCADGCEMLFNRLNTWPSKEMSGSSNNLNWKKQDKGKKTPKAAKALTDEEVNILYEKYLGFRNIMHDDTWSVCTSWIKT